MVLIRIIFFPFSASDMEKTVSTFERVVFPLLHITIYATYLAFNFATANKTLLTLVSLSLHQGSCFPFLWTSPLVRVDISLTSPPLDHFVIAAMLHNHNNL